MLLILYFPVLKDLIKQWINDSNYQHGLLIPPIIILLLKRKLIKLKSIPPHGDTFTGAITIGIAVCCLVAGTAAAELFTSRLSLVLFVLGSILMLAGKRFAKGLFNEFVLMILMIPLPYIIYYKLTFPLQLFSAKLSTGILQVLSVNVMRKGNILFLPKYTLEVVAACSGLRSLMTMVTLAVIITAFMSYSTTKKVFLVICSLPIAIAANVVRLVVTALGAYIVDARFADGFLHEISGLIVFATGLLLLIIINGILKWKK
jgi:exosortase